MDEWLNKLWNIHIIEYYSATKKKETQPKSYTLHKN